MIWRTLWHLLVLAPRQRRLSFHDVSRSRFRVWPTDLDLNGHMNNGKYLSIMDIGRFVMIQRTGVLRIVRESNWFPVVVAQTITYRKSLNPWQRFWIETAILGFDDQAIYLEQRFVRREDGTPQIYARAVVRARFVRKAGGPVSIDELLERAGASQADFSLPDWVAQWGQDTRLPSLRSDATSVWE